MKIFTTIFLAVTIYAIPFNKALAQFSYINPKPNSTFHNPESNIILKNGSLIDKTSLDPKLVSITGSVSGDHLCRITLSDDKKTILIYPTTKFAEGETVSVSVADGFKKKTGEIISGTSFSFETHRHYTSADQQSIKDALKACKENEYGAAAPFLEGGTREICHIPSHEIFSSGNEWDGDIFYYNFTIMNVSCFARTILNNQGDSLYADFNNNQGVDFKINENGYLTWYNEDDSSFMMADSTYTVVKEFFMGNGYRADNHEFLVYPDGHSFMFCYDTHPNIDLSQYGGLDTVDVTGLVVQELDSSGDVIFEWSSWDHFQVSDAININYQTSTTVDYVHGNSMDIDFDGNLLLSCRHMSEITKIDLSTGDIIWRLGGLNNQFTFVNDIDIAPHWFSWQHHFRRLPNGHYTLFNNNNHIFFPENPSSSAKEYALDQTNKTATLVWSYIHPKVNGYNVISNAMGVVQRLPNGNTFIDYGLILDVTQPFPRFTEVDSAGNIVWEFRFTVDSLDYVSYRAFKNKWDRCGAPVDSSYSVTGITSDSAFLSWGDPHYSSEYILDYKLNTSSIWTSITLSENSIWLSNLVPNSVYDWRVRSICSVFNDTSDYSATHQFSTISSFTNFAGNGASFYLYPNPSSTLVNISLELMREEPVLISISNLPGNVIRSESWDAKSGNNLKSIRVDDLAAGAYIIELKSADFSLRRTLVVR